MSAPTRPSLQSNAANPAPRMALLSAAAVVAGVSLMAIALWPSTAPETHTSLLVSSPTSAAASVSRSTITRLPSASARQTAVLGNGEEASRAPPRDPQASAPATPAAPVAAATAPMASPGAPWAVLGALASAVAAAAAYVRPRGRSPRACVPLMDMAATSRARDLPHYAALQDAPRVAMCSVSGEEQPAAGAVKSQTMVTSMIVVREALQEELNTTLNPVVKQLVSDGDSMNYKAMVPGVDLAAAPPSPAREAYITRIRTVARDKPYLLITHTYLWDHLAGRMIQILNSQESQKTQALRMRTDLVQRSIQLEDRLNNVMTLSDLQKEEIVDEATQVFDLNLGLLRESQDPALLSLYTDQLKAVSDKLLNTEGGTAMLAATGEKEGEAELTEEEKAAQEKEQAFLRKIDAEVRELTGEGLDSLLSPSKVVRIEKELLELREELEACDDDARRKELEQEIKAKADQSLIEKRGVMKGWLRNLFRGQAVFTGLASYALASNNVPGVAEVDLPLRALGFWSWWLLTIPSLRAIKPLEPQEKSALDWAFVGTLLASLLVPFATKDPGQIWAVDAAVVAACYGASYALGEPEPEEAARPADKERKAPDGPAVKALKEFGAFASTALDFGSGRERGTVETVNKTALEKLLEERVKEKVDETAGEDAE